MKVLILFVILILALPYTQPAQAESEQATFESLYRKKFSISWAWVVVPAVVVGGVAFVAITGGAGIPAVIATVGTSIGGAMGLSGIAATNAGLAMLGGGAIAAGGFGIAGGVAVIAAVFTFSTDLVLEYSIGRAMDSYNYNRLVAASKEMPTLMLPVNVNGSKVYADAIVQLGDIEIGEDTPISHPINVAVIHGVIANLTRQLTLERRGELLDVSWWKERPVIFTAGEHLRHETLLSILYFIVNDYQTAKTYAFRAISRAETEQLRSSVPTFIFAATSLYDEDSGAVNAALGHFREALVMEPDNHFVPILFSILLDRMFLRIEEGTLTDEDIDTLRQIAETEELSQHIKTNYAILLGRYLVRLKFEQQKILAMTGSRYEMLRSAPETVTKVTEALAKYQYLVYLSDNLVANANALKLSEKRDKGLMELFELQKQYAEESSRLKLVVHDYKDELGVSDS